MFVLLEGQVELTKRAEGGSQLLKCVDRPNEFFGEMALIDDQPRSATATATTETRLLVVNDATFEQLVRSNGEFAIKLIRVLAARIRETNRSLSEVAATSPKDRFIRGMIDYALKHGEPMYDGGIKVNVKAMQEWINSHVGLSLKQIEALTYRLIKGNDTPYAPASAKSGECVVLSRDFIARHNRRKFEHTADHVRAPRPAL
jgi:CRP/FNR family transcriptional regulator